MRDRSLDEFEAVFEQAYIPVLDIKTVPFTRLAAVVVGGSLDDSILSMASHLRKRFGGEVEVHWPGGRDVDEALQAARRRGLSPCDRPFASTAELVGQVSIGRSQLILLSAPEGDDTGAVELDALVRGTAPPILVVRTPIESPPAVFRRILHSLTGNFQQSQNFSCSFTLVEGEGSLELLHVIDESEIEDVRRALQVSPDIAAESGDELLESLAHHGERFLKAVVAAGRERRFEASYRLAVGEIVPTVRDALSAGDFGLLVVGSHHEGHSHVDANDYQLMHEVRDIPVLAL